MSPEFTVKNVRTSEPDEGQRLSEENIAELTAGQPRSIRNIRASGPDFATGGLLSIAWPDGCPRCGRRSASTRRQGGVLSRLSSAVGEYAQAAQRFPLALFRRLMGRGAAK